VYLVIVFLSVILHMLLLSSKLKRNLIATALKLTRSQLAGIHLANFPLPGKLGKLPRVNCCVD
jgi:hypothetical protein